MISLFSPRSRRSLARSRTAWALLVAGVAAAGLAPAAHAADVDDVSWSVRTASNGMGADRTAYAYTLDAGMTINDAIVVVNHGAEDISLKVYAADGATSDTGDLALLPADEPSRAVGVWITAQEPQVTVAAGETSTIPFTITVPLDATPGDYAGGIVTSLDVPDATTGVTVDRRLGIRVDLRVGGELAPALAVDGASVSWGGGLNPFSGADATLTYTLHNTGNTKIAAAATAHVSGLLGMFGQTVSTDDATSLLPGESRTVTATIAGVPPLVFLLADVAVTPLVTDVSGSTSPIEVVTASAFGLAVPWMLLLIVVLLAVAIVMLARGRRRRSAAQRQAADERVDAAVQAALAQERARAGATASAAPESVFSSSEQE